MDAMHTQTDTAELIIARGADYVMTVKANMPTLYKRLKKLPWADIPSTSTITNDHGRRARRTIKVAAVPAWIEFKGAAQIAQLRRTVTRNGKKTVEVVYLITSADTRSTDSAMLAAWVRGHWHIENKLHWVRDVTYQEDKSLIRTGNAPRVMATLRSLEEPRTFRTVAQLRFGSVWRGMILPRPKRNFTPEYREQAVKSVIETSRPIAQVAKELGLNEGTLGNWVSAYKRDHAGEEPPLTVNERARLRELERETRELQMELAFLKKAAAYFAKDHR
jgi:transposase-like protein/predicted transposase YbfD/YdcC